MDRKRGHFSSRITRFGGLMADVHTALQRRRNMQAIRGRDTKPELVVRRTLHRMGYRFRLHRPDLPGRPDIVFPARSAVLFVHGCFWHRHDCPNGRQLPKTRTHWWREKLDSNRRRDAAAQRKLRRLGWRVMVVWECQLSDIDRVTRRMTKFLD